MDIRRFFGCLVGAAIALVGVVAAADEVKLRGGGKITGLILDDEPKDREIRVLTVKGVVPVPRHQAVEEKIDGEPAARYAATATLLKSDDLDGHVRLAAWCESNGLSDEAKTEFETIISIDPDHAAARRRLGFVRRNEKWLRIEDLASKSKSPADVAAASGAATGDMPVIPDPITNSTESLASRRVHWDREVPKLAKMLTSRIPNVVTKAKAELADIRDPMAVNALVRAMSAPQTEVRERLVKAIAEIDGPEATGALSLVSILDPSSDLRWLAMDSLHGRDPRAYRPALVAALRSPDREIIFNGAEVAAELGDKGLVPPLIGALTSTSRSSFIAPEIAGFADVPEKRYGEKIGEREVISLPSRL